MFTLDHPNYSRWLSVHYRDMQALSSRNPDVYKCFMQGCLVVHKTKRRFSSIALDRAHEQENAIVKGQGGAVGLAEDPGALRRWMVAGPELSRIIKEFEADTFSEEDQKHHEQKPGFQRSFFRDVVNTVSSLEEFGNPFEEEGEYLLAIHNKDVKSNEVIEAVRNAKRIGEEHFNLFLKERFVEKSKPVTHPIKKMCLSIFITPEKKKVPADKAKLHVLQQDCSLFSRLYIACQFRDGNLEDFFKYENQPWPPSLSQFGQLSEGQKADLINCLTSLSAQVPTTTKPSIDAVIIDGAVIVQMLHPTTVRTFDEYFTAIFAPCILRILQNSSRIDLV